MAVVVWQYGAVLHVLLGADAFCDVDLRQLQSLEVEDQNDG